MDKGCRPDEEDLVLLTLRVGTDLTGEIIWMTKVTQRRPPYIELCLGVGHDLSLLRHPLADEDGPDVGFHQGGVPHVAHPGQDHRHRQPLDGAASPEEQTVGSVPLTYDSISTEHEGGGALLGARHLAEHYPYHARLDHHTHDGLQRV